MGGYEHGNKFQWRAPDMTTIRTTHVGALPRTQAVVDFLFARERGEPCDPAAFSAAMRAHVDDLVARKVAAGMDIVPDGETSKISYATYVKDRYTGFSGDGPRGRDPRGTAPVRRED